MERITDTEAKAYRLGLLGEMKAEAYLKKNGIRILKRRFRSGSGEIDLIGEDQEIICFIEVKYRPRGVPGEGLRAVDSRKIERIRKTAAAYMKGKKERPVRYDVLEIAAAGITYLRNAF